MPESCDRCDYNAGAGDKVIAAGNGDGELEENGSRGARMPTLGPKYVPKIGHPDYFDGLDAGHPPYRINLLTILEA